MLASSVQASYVDLFGDVNFKQRLTRITHVSVDICYSFSKCGNLDNRATSAKWSGLPEAGSHYNNGNTIIVFYSAANCKAPKAKWWKVRTQSDTNPDFPTNFQLDGLSDTISSFNVIYAGGYDRVEYVCGVTEMINATSANGTVEFL
ncbi:hypothetical protein PF008_g19693 [Phytophthora fragariae]|uniref:Uncharacterized protein n=1 Tax=Phytophthora fragariae TaxID=53985 RepID=A0A6G0R1M7_9STRA|nr:hypothetical protein PF008_g19693 [Phytophthora fragariae]